MKHPARLAALAVAVVVVVFGVVLALNVGADPQEDAKQSHLVGKAAPNFQVIIVGPENSDPYAKHSDAIRKLALHYNISLSRETVLFASRRSSARSARCFWPPRSSACPSESTSSGPRIRNSIAARS